MIEVRGLTKTFKDRKAGRVEALRGVSFDCRAGEVFGLLGPNGAGKTTALRILSTAIKPTAGRATVMGHDVATQARQVRKSIGFLSGTTELYGRLTPREVLRYFGRLFYMSESGIDARIGELADAFEMDGFLDRPCDKLSTGMRQKANIARAVIHSPPVVIFDEPTKGLDVLTGRAIVDFVSQCRRQQRTVLFSTHIMSEVERLCDRVAVIHLGSLLYSGTLDELRGRYGTDLEEVFLTLVEEGS